MRDRGRDERKVAARVAEQFGEQEEAFEEDGAWELLPAFVALMFGLLLEVCWGELGEVMQERDETPNEIDFINVSAWSSAYSYRLIKGINETSRTQLAEVMAEYATKPYTFGELRQAIGMIFGPDRAARIAVTEVTRAYTEAARKYAEHMAALGLTMREFWVTSRDERVCEICAPRDGMERDKGYTSDDGPPAHPNCRCDVRHEVA